MTKQHIATAATLLACAATSQTNAFVFYPQDPERQTVTCTSYVGRPSSSAQAEAMMEISTDHFRGVGEANGPIKLFGVYHWIADENLSTSETYDLVVRSADPLGPGPDMSVAGEELRISGLTSPPSTSTARGTWITYDGFGQQAPLSLLDPYGPSAPPYPAVLGRYYVGVDLPQNASWPASDGHSLFRADLISANTSATVGENERAGAPEPTWGGSVGSAPYTTPWTYILGPLVTTPNLHLGGIDPTSTRLGAPGANLSMNGLYPDISGMPRSDGLMMRITDTIAPQAVVFLGANYQWEQSFFYSPLAFTLIGSSYIGDGSTLVPLGISSLSNGVLEVPIQAPGAIPSSLVGMEAVFQAMIWDIQGPQYGAANWTNAQVVKL